MLQCLFVGLGGFVGCILRYLITWIPCLQSMSFPFATLLINMVGSFAISVLSELFLTSSIINTNMLLFLQVGLCGGFTTFSTFSLEAMKLLQSGKLLMGIGYALLSVTLCLVCVFWGKLLVKAMFA